MAINRNMDMCGDAISLMVLANRKDYSYMHTQVYVNLATSDVLDLQPKIKI